MDALEVEARAKGWGEVIVTGSRPYAAYQWDEAYPDETTRVLSDADNVALARLQTQWDERLAEIGAAGDEDFDPNSDDVLIAIHHDMAGSEEHTSELQSLMRSSYAVCCLKKTKIPARDQSKPQILI